MRENRTPGLTRRGLETGLRYRASPRPYEILKWGTPFEGKFTSDCFDVQNDGEQILYVGMLVKRGAPQAVDFINIGANEEISEILKLENGYEIYKAGAYTVRYREDAIRVKAELASQKEDAEVEFF